MKKYTKTLVMALLLTTCILLTACGVINVSGKTFRFSKVTIDWGLAEEENKQSIFQEYQVFFPLLWDAGRRQRSMRSFFPPSRCFYIR